MDCHDVRLLLTLHRREPEQLDAVELEALECHIELCPGCQNWNRSEARFDVAVTSAVKNVPLPVGLKDKISGRLRETRAPRRKTWLAVAAAFLLMVGGGTGTYFWMQPEFIDWHPISDEFEKQGADEQTVENYFAGKGYAMTPPPQFMYDYLLTYELAFFQGKLVPRLTFQCQQNNRVVTANVYCLSTRQFRFDESQVPESSPHRQIQVIQGESEIYVVKCIGGDVSMLKRGTY